jgi:hypothetical protein
MRDNADPLHGWSLGEVFSTTSGAATADTYGKLFYYLRGLLHSFLDRIFELKVSFKLLHLDAADLPDHLDEGSFSRIDVRDQPRHFFIPTYLCTPTGPVQETSILQPKASLRERH